MRFIARAASLCDFGFPSWREIWFPRSVVLLSLLTEFAMAAFVIVDGFVWFCLTAISILRMTPGMIQCYHHSFSTCIITEQLITLPSFVRFVFVCFGLLFAFFFRPTPLGFRQVVQHVRLHVATSELTLYCNDVGSSMTASTVELARTDT